MTKKQSWITINREIVAIKDDCSNTCNCSNFDNYNRLNFSSACFIIQDPKKTLQNEIVEKRIEKGKKKMREKRKREKNK
jgi:hypothetical protein